MRVVGTVPFKNTCTVEESGFKAETKKMSPLSLWTQMAARASRTSSKPWGTL